MTAPDAPEREARGSQTLVRGLDLIDIVTERPMRVAELSERMGLTRITTGRIVKAFLDRGFLASTADGGVGLGRELLRLGQLAREQTDILRLARPPIEALSARIGLCVFLGRREGDLALHLDRVAGRQRLEVATRPGDRRSIVETGLGKALLLDDDEASWVRLLAQSDQAPPAAEWIAEMRGHVRDGIVLHRSDETGHTRSVAAPIRDASGGIAAAISVATATQYLDDARMQEILPDVRRTAAEIGAMLGWRGDGVTAG